MNHRNTYLYFSGIGVSLIGSHIYLVAMIVWLKDVYGANQLIGLFQFTSSSIMLLFIPFAGVWIDRLTPKKVLVFSDLASGLVMASLALWIVVQPAPELQIIGIMASAAILAVLSSFIGPSSLSLLNELFPAQDHRYYNSVRANIVEASNFVGKGVGGLLVAVVSIPLLIALNACSYFVSAFSECFLKITPPENEGPTRSKKAYFSQLLEGFSFVKNQPVLVIIFSLACFTNFMLSLCYVLFPALISDVMALPTWWYGQVMAAFGLGAFLGGWLSARVRQRVLKKMMRGALVFQCIPFLWIGFATSALEVIAAMVLVGLCFIFVQVNFITYISGATPQEMKGRVFSLMSFFVGIAMPIGYLTGGWVGDHLDIQVVWVYRLTGVLVPLLWATYALPGWKRNPWRE